MKYDASKNSFLHIGILLTIVFTILKLCNVIDWSWWFVCLPVIIGVLITLVAIIVATWLYINIVKPARKSANDRFEDLRHGRINKTWKH